MVPNPVTAGYKKTAARYCAGNYMLKVWYYFVAGVGHDPTTSGL